MPDGITLEILHSYTKVVNGLDSVEAKGIVYLVAFDLNQFSLKYALGTDHPKVSSGKMRRPRAERNCVSRKLDSSGPWLTSPNATARI